MGTIFRKTRLKSAVYKDHIAKVLNTLVDNMTNDAAIGQRTEQRSLDNLN